MRKFVVVVFLLLCTLAPVHAQKTRFGQEQPNKAVPGIDYPIKLHISGIHLRSHCIGDAACEDMIYADAILDGKKIELRGDQNLFFRYKVRLFPGDYQARLLKDADFMEGTPIYQVYELLLPDRYVWRGTVTGISE